MSSVEMNVFARPNDRLRRRKLVGRGVELIAWLAAALGVGVLGILVGYVAERGASQLNLDLFTKAQAAAFSLTPGSQGLANAFAGSLVLIGIATAMAVPVGILIAIYVSEFAPRAVKPVVTLVLDLVAGIPAIVVSIFIYGLIEVGHGQTGLAVSYAVAVIMLPFVARSTIEVLALVPSSLREAALGLGAPRWRTTLGVVLPQTIGGILTGTVLAVARVSGETAPPLLLSYVVSQGVAWNPVHALQTVPLAIYELGESGTPSDTALAWAGAFVLIVFILVVSLSARYFAARSRRKLGASR